MGRSKKCLKKANKNLNQQTSVNAQVAEFKDKSKIANLPKNLQNATENLPFVSFALKDLGPLLAEAAK